MKERPVRVWSDLILETVERHVEPVVDDVPTAELDLAELRMVDLVPLDVRVRVVLLRPLDQGEIVLDRVVANPIREVVVGEAGLPLRAPELRRPREGAEVVVHPVVCTALDRLLGLVLEVVEDGDGRVPGERGAALADDSVRA